MGSAWPWYLLPASLDPYGCSTGPSIRMKEIWPIGMPAVDGDREVGDVRELERQVALEAGIDEAGGAVDQQAEPAEARLALEPGDEVVGQPHPLERLAEHELAGVQDERLVALDSTSSVRSSIGSRTSMYGRRALWKTRKRLSTRTSTLEGCTRLGSKGSKTMPAGLDLARESFDLRAPCEATESIRAGHLTAPLIEVRRLGDTQAVRGV